VNAPFGWPAIRSFYGWEDRFLVDLAGWEARMVIVPAPRGCSFFFDQDADTIRDPGEGARGIRVHPRIAIELAECLRLIHDAGLWRFVEPIAGGYMFRQQRGGSKLSMHALGGAVDFDVARNPFRVDPERTALGTDPGLGVVRIFEEHGWQWGGRWDQPDAQHLQFGGGF
jgi:hypothetical protein